MTTLDVADLDRRRARRAMPAPRRGGAEFGEAARRRRRSIVPQGAGSTEGGESLASQS